MKKPSRFDVLRNTLSKLISTKNSMSLPNLFLKYGNKTMPPDWTDVVMSDRDLYTGYSYGAIRVRSNLVARIALENVVTDSKMNNAESDYKHPYLEAISNSMSFPDYKFWSDISTYLDLEGIYYLMAVRNYENNDNGSFRVGAIKEFKMLSPYNVVRIMDPNNPTIVKGYVETRKGMVREIPPEMIIEMRELNPFDEDNPFSMTDAAKESQFTLKTANDFTRHALKGNINSPGILSTDVVLEEEEFKRFIERLRSHGKGEPIFGNGSGAVNWESMQTELSKSALKDVNEMNRDSLFAVSGVSKTIMAIEQSGVTRETSKTQRDLMIENHILPRIQLIIDSLNQDYENKYPEEYAKTGASIVVLNPLATDHDADLKNTEVKTKQLEIYSKLIQRGVDNETASKYVKGEIELEDLNLKPVEEPIIEPDKTKKEDDESENRIVTVNRPNDILRQQEASLKNQIQNLEGKLVGTMLINLKSNFKNALRESELIDKQEKKDFINELLLLLGAFYGIIVNLKGQEISRSRALEFALPAQFIFNSEVKKKIQEMSKKVSDSHINTVVDDVYKVAKEAALQGKGLSEIEDMITKKYGTQISETRAATIARTETNRAFTIAQYEADKQFVDENGLEGRVYKQWRTRSANPCEFCLALQAEGPILFSNNFRNIGDVINVNDKILQVEFDHLQAGNAHPNCNCDYELIIRNEKNALSLGDEIKKVQELDNEIHVSVEKTKRLYESVVSKEAQLNEKEQRLIQKEKELDQLLTELENI